MSNTQIAVPASLIAQVGTGLDVHGIIGKRVRISRDTSLDIPAPIRELLGIPPTPVGAEGTAIHVSESGEVWVDFGDDERVDLAGPEGERARVAGLGPVGGEPGYPQMFEIVE